MDESTESSATTQTSDDLSKADIEDIVDKRIEERSNSGRTRSRRSILAALGGGTVLGFLGSGSVQGYRRQAQTPPSDFEVADIETQNLHAAHISVEDLVAGNINGIRVAEDASEIQKHINELDGERTGYTSDGKADRPGGGVVLLKRQNYQPTSTIRLKTGVTLRGVQSGGRQGRDHHEWTFSSVSANNLPSGEPIIEIPPDNVHTGVENVILNGAGQNVHGLKVGAGSGSFRLSQAVIERVGGHGFWTRGSLDTYIWNSVIQGGDFDRNTYAVFNQSEDGKVGSGTNDTQLRIGGFCRIKSSGVGGGANGNTCIRNESSICWISLDHGSILTRNENEPNIPTVHNGSKGTPLVISDTMVSGGNQDGVHGIKNHGNLHLDNIKVEKVDVGIIENGRSNSQWSNVRVKQCRSVGILVNNQPGAWSDILVRDNNDDGILVDSAQCFNPWSNVRVTGNGQSGTGYGINVTGVKGGDIPFISGFRAAGNASGAINDPSLVWIGNTRSGYVNRSSGTVNGTGTTSSSQTVTVSHHMDDLPEQVFLSPRNSAAATTMYWHNPTSTTFDITLDPAPDDGSSFKLDWYAIGASGLRS